MARKRKPPAKRYVSEINRSRDDDRVMYDQHHPDEKRSEIARDRMQDFSDEEYEDRRQSYLASNRTYSDRLSEGFEMLGE